MSLSRFLRTATLTRDKCGESSDLPSYGFRRLSLHPAPTCALQYGQAASLKISSKLMELTLLIVMA
jgi:hypothetical protein